MNCSLRDLQYVSDYSWQAVKYVLCANNYFIILFFLLGVRVSLFTLTFYTLHVTETPSGIACRFWTGSMHRLRPACQLYDTSWRRGYQTRILLQGLLQLVYQFSLSWCLSVTCLFMLAIVSKLSSQNSHWKLAALPGESEGISSNHYSTLHIMI